MSKRLKEPQISYDPYGISWEKELDILENHGHVDSSTKLKSSDWFTCAVGQALKLRKLHYGTNSDVNNVFEERVQQHIGRIVSPALYGCGMDFTSAVRENNVEAARAALAEIKELVVFVDAAKIRKSVKEYMKAIA